MPIVSNYSHCVFKMKKQLQSRRTIFSSSKIFTNFNKLLGALVCSDKIGYLILYRYYKFLYFEEEEKNTKLRGSSTILIVLRTF